MTPTPEQLALARKIAKRTVKSHDLQRDNGFEYAIALDSALAAIIETSERAIALADRLNGVGSPRRSYVGDALRNNEHLKGDGR